MNFATTSIVPHSYSSLHFSFTGIVKSESAQQNDPVNLRPTSPEPLPLIVPSRLKDSTLLSSLLYCPSANLAFHRP